MTFEPEEGQELTGFDGWSFRIKKATHGGFCPMNDTITDTIPRRDKR